MTLGTLQKALIEGMVEDPSLARKIASAGRVYTGIAAADTNATAANQNATNAHIRLNDPVLLGKYQLDLGIQSVVGALALANLPPIPQTKLNAITDPSKLVSATLGVLQNASANQSGYAGFQSAVGANLLAAWTVVAGRAIIAQATIQDGHIASLSANKMTAGAISTGTIDIISSLTAGFTTINNSGISLGGAGSLDPPNSNPSSKLSGPRALADSITYASLWPYVNSANLVRGWNIVAAGIAGGSTDGIISLTALPYNAADYGALSTGRFLVQANSATGRGIVEARNTDLFVTSGGNATIDGNLFLHGRLAAPYELTSTAFAPSGAAAFQRNHGLGRVPWRVNIQYTSATLTSWYDAPSRSAGADVSYNYDATTIYFYNNRSENVTIRMQAF